MNQVYTVYNVCQQQRRKGVCTHQQQQLLYFLRLISLKLISMKATSSGIPSAQVVQVDSVVCNFDRYPYSARTYARQLIIRASNVTERSLVTECRLLNTNRSDDNPNGFNIEGFEIMENKDINTRKR